MVPTFINRNEMPRGLAQVFQSKTHPSHRPRGHRAPTQRQQEATICVGIYDANRSFGQNQRSWISLCELCVGALYAPCPPRL